jgi:hypothetical protein
MPPNIRRNRSLRRPVVNLKAVAAVFEPEHGYAKEITILEAVNETRQIRR